MAITVGNGTLLSMNVQFESGVIDATVVYQLSNTTSQKIPHNGIPILAIQSHALQAGRSDWTTTDVCQWIAANNLDFAPNIITPATL